MRFSPPFRGVALAALAFLGSFAPAASIGQSDFPEKPLRLIVPTVAGGPADALARAVAQRMSMQLGQPIVIENIAGASGTIGMMKVTRSPPDGYTLGFGTVGTHVGNVALYKNLPYDPIADFEPIGLAGSAPLMLLTRPDFPANTLPEFVTYLMSHPGKVSYASAGVGTISHFGCVILLASLKQEVLHVPYRGVSPAMNDLMGGQVDFMCDQTITALPLVLAGRIKSISLLTDQKLPQLPQLQSAVSAGYPDVNIRSWMAIFAPKSTPASLVDRLNRALATAVADPQLRQQMDAVGVALPAADGTAASRVTSLITLGVKRDVPLLKARREFVE